MRVTVGAIAVLGLVVTTVAVAQPPRERAAQFKPPQAVQPGELPVARGAADDFPAPSSLGTTPITRPNGAPVFAGPPAYRWYGWGTVTPGANQFAPAGQYPRGSANWYVITGATPGAFPVPVSNPVQNLPGTEPPTWGLTRSQPTPQPVV